MQRINHLFIQWISNMKKERIMINFLSFCMSFKGNKFSLRTLISCRAPQVLAMLFVDPCQINEQVLFSKMWESVNQTFGVFECVLYGELLLSTENRSARRNVTNENTLFMSPCRIEGGNVGCWPEIVTRDGLHSITCT